MLQDAVAGGPDLPLLPKRKIVPIFRISVADIIGKLGQTGANWGALIGKN
jgi:hypothetical protein